jgi:ABC-type transport system substrate-binding protein
VKRALGVIVGALVASALVTGVADAQKKTLVVALNQDPDILDPTLSRTYVGRIIFSQICEKLYEIDERLAIHPQLAAAMPAVSDGGKTVTIKLRPNVKFNDGTPMNAEAVRFSLDRHQTMKASNRRSELESVTAIEVVDPLTVRLRLKAPFSPLTAQLADRAGMPVSPAAAQKLGEKFGTAPVCVGPWQFVERVSQDRIVVERAPHYFDPGQAKFDRIVFRIIPDDNVRLANLRSGDIDVMHQVTPTDASSLKKDAKFEVSSVTGLGFNSITINLRNKTGKFNPPGDLGTPLANDPRLRANLAEQHLLRQDADVPEARRRARQETPRGGRASQRLCVRDGHRQQSAAAPGRGSHPGYGARGGLQHLAAAVRVRLRAQGQRRRQAPGVPDRLERARGPRRQHPPGAGVQGQPQRHAGV